MNYPWLDEYLCAQKGACKEYKLEWECFRYMLAGKMFAMVGADNHGKSIVTLKMLPENGAILRAQHSDIIPGYYMNKEHWNSVFLDGSVPDEVLRAMVDESHRLILGSLSKKAQQLKQE